MKGFCIFLNVSKKSSFYQGFKSIYDSIIKSIKIEHSLEAFNEVLNLRESI